MRILHFKIFVFDYRNRYKNLLELIVCENIGNSRNMNVPTRLHGVASHKATVFTVTTVGF